MALTHRFAVPPLPGERAGVRGVLINPGLRRGLGYVAPLELAYAANFCYGTYLLLQNIVVTATEKAVTIFCNSH
jgi:hypothetical protein